MKKNIIMTILICVTAVSMIIGILWHVTGTIRPDREDITVREAVDEMQDRMGKEIKIRDAKGSAEAQDPDETAEKTDQAENEDQAENADRTEPAKTTGHSDKNSELTSLEITMNIGDIIVRPGQELKVDYSGENKYEPEVRQNGSTLSIIQPKTRTAFNIGAVRSKLTLTLPEEISLETVHIQEDLGDIELNEIFSEEMTVENDLGDIDITDCQITDMDVISNMGEVDIKECVFSNLKVIQDLGDVKISTPQDLSGAALDLRTDLGTIKINGKEQGTKHTREGKSGISITVENDMGDIKLNTAFSDEDAA